MFNRNFMLSLVPDIIQGHVSEITALNLYLNFYS